MRFAGGKIVLPGAGVLLGVGLVVARLVGCSSPSSKTGRASGANATGAAALELQLGKVTLSALSWTMTNGAFSRMGSADASKGERVRFVVTDLPAAAGYTLALTGTTNGSPALNCTGSADFDVVANGTSPVVLSLVCGGVALDGRSNGSLVINGAAPIRPSCAAVTALSASPAEANVGGSVLLTAAGVSGSGASSGLRFIWSVVGGTGTGSLGERSSASSAFTCTTAGPIVVAVTASTGSGGACANNSKTMIVACNSPPSAAAAPASGSRSALASRNKWWWSPPSASGGSPGAAPALGRDGYDLSAGAASPSLAAGGAASAAASGGIAAPSGGSPGSPNSGPGGGAAPGGGGGSLPGSPCAAFNNPPGETAKGCTQTEQRFVDKSVECYTCLVDGSCLDDLKFGDMGKECEDVTAIATSGPRKGSANSALCLATIDCILATNCASTDVAECYCGSLLGVACATSTRPGDGACAQAEAEGADHAIKDPASVVSPLLADVTLPAGKADAIFHCGNLNGCGALCSQ